MGGLVNGRRGGRSPPLVIGALIACIIVLGFNYWVSSSRTLELQTKMYELEGQVRRGAAERGASELKKNEYQEEIQRQKDQISHIESLYKKQLEGVQNTCSQNMGILQQNISSSTKTIQELQGQLNQMNDDVGKLQKELQGCQGNINTLNNKLTYDMTHCNSQVLSQRELCDERVEAAKMEVQKKMEKLLLLPAVPQGKAENGGVKEEAVAVTMNTATNSSDMPSPSVTKGNELPSLQTNEIFKEDNVLDLPPAKDIPLSDTTKDATAVKQHPPAEGALVTEKGQTSKALAKNQTEVEVIDAHTEEADPGMEGMLIGPGKEDAVGHRGDETEDYDQAGGVDLEKREQPIRDKAIDKVMEEELADYNGDDDNEGEFEADKEAELAQV
ncbi:Golgi membrane protein 1 [Entelurus aequoreus]|uniref:Golgi membrane protein 1 n=1 Tax=Entelurus aequoreus TaxID=161455 RepID=UPI002B1D74EC|nr:Golgi membrane protein 1 [Entelurus aequoreus]XP_061881837.1 Golgi membrane protein 1 [Entelurus aequoreus]XP_061881838.1 Golgi membrane protein 1 [Entelurus aequoreus]